jgi:lipid A 3-O-deacylase
MKVPPHRISFRSAIRTAVFVAAQVGLVAFALPSPGQTTTNQGPSLTVWEENDLVVDTDRHYTQGIKWAYFHEDGYLPLGSAWLYRTLPTWGFTSQAGKFGYAVGQNMYTPANYLTPLPQPADRPYAGWLYGGLMLHRRGETTRSQWPILESLELQVGVVGPWSLAKDAQIWVHQIRGFALPQGWANQINNEPGFDFRYERSLRWTLAQRGPFAVQFLPEGGFSLGNIETGARLGGTVRAGFYLPDDYGLTIIDSLTTSDGGTAPADGWWSIYGFASSEGKLVLRNEFLDGDLFSDSPSVEKKFAVGDFKTGFAVVLFKHLEVGYTYVFRTPEFRGQTTEDRFGSGYLKYMWNF